MRHHHHHQRELDPRPNRGVVSNLTSAWIDEQKQLKAAPKDDESTTTTKEQTYSGDFTVPPMIPGQEKLSVNSSPSLDTTTEDQTTSNGKIQLSRNLRLQNIHSAVQKLSSEERAPTSTATNTANDKGTTSKGKKGVAKRVKKSVRSIFGKTHGGGGGEEENKKAEDPQEQQDPLPEAGGKAPNKKADEQDLDSSRHQVNIRSRTEESVCRRRRRDAERQKRRGGARNAASPKRTSRLSPVSNAAEEPQVTRRGHSTGTSDERERHRQSNGTPDTPTTSLASCLEDVKATQDILSATKHESTTIEQSFDRFLEKPSERDESEHTRSTILDFPISSLNDFPGVNLPTDIKPKTSLVVDLLDSVNGSSRHESTSSSALQDSSHRQQLLEYPKVLQDPKKKRSNGLDQKSSHHRPRNRSRSRNIDSNRRAAAAVNEPETPVLYLHASDSELENSTRSSFSETPSAFRGPHKARKQKSKSSRTTKNTAPSDRSRKERSVSGTSRSERNNGTRVSTGSQDLVDVMDRSSFSSSSRTGRERKEMSVSDATHVRKSRIGSYGALLFEQWSPKRSKSLSTRRLKPSSARENEPIDDNPTKRSSSASAQRKTRRKASSDKKQNRRQLEVEKEARARILNPTGQGNVALPDLLSLTVAADGKALATKEAETSGPPDVTQEMQTSVNPFNVNATVLDLPRAASFLSATSTLQSSSYHPRTKQREREKDKTMSISYHGKAAAERSTSLPPKSDQRGEQSPGPGVTKKMSKKTSTKEKSKASGQKKDRKDSDLAAGDHEKARLSNSANKDQTRSRNRRHGSKSEKKQKDSDGQKRSSSVPRKADDSMPKRTTSSKTKDGLMSFSIH